MHLPASEIDIVRIALQDKPAQHAMKTLLVNLLGFNAKTWQLGNIHEWDNKKTTPGVSPLYSELLIASRLRR